jgi:negative regulator of genetic competence, sporulation and motility
MPDEIKKVDPMQQLLEVILKREAREALLEDQKQQQLDAKAKQRDINAKSAYEDAQAKQAKCTHLKGGKNRIRTQAKDYNIYMHTFINAERVIVCCMCGMKWKMKDTKEFLFRFGKKVPNHTKIGWDEACEMLGQTSNQNSSSEIPMNASPVALPTD